MWPSTRSRLGPPSRGAIPALVLSLAPALALLPTLLACEKPPEPAPRVADESTVRRVAQGELVGYAGSFDSHSWRGIPFAQPPVGPLRWHAPRPPKPWKGRLEATVQGAPCPQFAGPGGGPDGEEPGQPVGDEDCLTLNVFAPPFAPDEVPQGDERLPVLFWIHGGGNTIGDSRVYDGGHLATRHDLVVVSVQYRLGAFGWFTHPSLRREGMDARDLSGNWGTLDLIRALDWTRENIGAFGGDPDDITIFGESAGGTNVFSLLVSPAARGHFQKAIVQSGGLTTHTRAEAENLHDASEAGDEWSSGEVLLRLFQADGAVDRAAAKVRLASMREPKIAEYLRAKSADEILGAYAGERMGGMYRIPTLIRDGRVIPHDEPAELFARAGGTADVPTILGTNRDENKLFLLFTSPHVARAFGIPLWLKDEAAYDLAAEYESRAWKLAGVDGPADAMSRARRAPIFAYRFDWDEEPTLLWADFSEMLGAAHAVEIPFVFGTLDLGRGNRFLWDEDRIGARDELSDAMMSYWANFAHTGDPGSGRDGRLPRWQRWDVSSPSAPKFVVLDTGADGGIRMSSEVVALYALVARLASDERFTSERDRCEIYFQLASWRQMLSEEEYATACPDLPMDGYPWDD